MKSASHDTTKALEFFRYYKALRTFSSLQPNCDDSNDSVTLMTLMTLISDSDDSDESDE